MYQVALREDEAVQRSAALRPRFMSLRASHPRDLLFASSKAAKDSFQAVKLQRPARATVCSHSQRDMAANSRAFRSKPNRWQRTAQSGESCRLFASAPESPPQQAAHNAGRRLFPRRSGNEGPVCEDYRAVRRELITLR